MPKQYPSEVRGRAVRMVLDRLDGYPSLWAVCQDIGLELDVGPKSLGTWVVQVQTDAGQRSGPTSNELDEIRRLKRGVTDLKEANEILRSVSTLFTRENDPDAPDCASVRSDRSSFHPGRRPASRLPRPGGPGWKRPQRPSPNGACPGH
jgi:transposase